MIKRVVCICITTIAFVCCSLSVLAKETPEYHTSNDTNGGGAAFGAIRTTQIYSSPDTSSEVLGYVIAYQVIRSFDSKNDYLKIRYGDGCGYVLSSDFITGDDLSKSILQNKNWCVANVLITADNTPLYDWVTGAVVKVAACGNTFQLYEETEDFYTIIYTVVNKNGNETNTLLNVSKNNSKTVFQVHVTSFEDCKLPMNEIRMNLVDYACSFVGCDYVWGGNDPASGVDCSGFVRYVYSHFNYALPRCSWQQAEFGQRISFEEMKPGDLIFYKRGNRIGHVTMYIGDGQCVQARGQKYGVCITAYDYSKPAWAVRIIKED